MPWRETDPMNEKMKFIAAYLEQTEDTFQALCERFAISCKTGYKYVKRYEEEGPQGLEERSRAPHAQLNRLPEWVEENILEIKHKYPHWGAKKILNWLIQERSTVQWPARSTIETVLRRHQLVRPGKRKRRVNPYSTPLVLCTQPNDCWSIDYKGQFRMGNQELCYPLTITDNFSRYILAIQGNKAISGAQVQNVLKQLFEEFGLPHAIRSDNGVPFAGCGITGLTRVAVWLIQLGVIPERIRTGHPEENGRHERMHLTLQQETASPAQWDLSAQQRCFDEFIKMFNQERPHEGIGFQRPTHLYSSSSRVFPEQIAPIEYDSSFEHVRRVRKNGRFKWKGTEVFLSQALQGEAIGMKPKSEYEWVVFYSRLPIGIFNEKTLKTDKL